MDHKETDYTEMDKIMHSLGCTGSGGIYYYHRGLLDEREYVFDLSARKLEWILNVVIKASRQRGREELQQEIKATLGL